MAEEKQAIRARLEEMLARYRSGGRELMINRFDMTFVDCDPERMEFEAVCTITPEMGNFYGILHGGWIASIMDTAMGTAVRAFAQYDIVSTVNLSVNYMKPVPLDTRLHVTARVEGCGKSIAYASARVWSEDHPERTLDTAKAVFSLRVKSADPQLWMEGLSWYQKNP